MRICGTCDFSIKPNWRDGVVENGSHAVPISAHANFYWNKKLQLRDKTLNGRAFCVMFAS